MGWFLHLIFRRNTQEERHQGLSENPCLSIKLKQDELAFIQTISTLQLSTALLKMLRLAMFWRKKNPSVPNGSRRTSGSRVRAAQLLSTQLAGNRKANELSCSGNTMEMANRRPPPGAESEPLPANSYVTGEQAAFGRRKPGPSG